jgi:hypothetical protein
MEQNPSSEVARSLLGFHIPCILGDWWLGTLFRVFCHWNLSLASCIVSTSLTCLLRSFLILSVINRQVSWVVWSLQLLWLYFVWLFLILHVCHITCWSHPLTWKGGKSEGDQGTLIFSTLRLLYPRKPFDLDVVTKWQCLPVSGIDPVLPLS